jgi:hypothetical protein
MTMMVAQMPMVMTPHIATPSVLQQAIPPWVTQTPESSPMLWGCAPPSEYMSCPTMAAPRGISKDFLRAVCEPFFDQMLMAVQQALQVQAEQASDATHLKHGMYQAPCQGTHVINATCGQPCEEPSTVDGSETSDSGAFSSVLTPPSTQRADEEHVKPAEEAFAALMCNVSDYSKAFPTHSEAPERNRQEVDSEGERSDQEKSVMVCRHWKSKGWCRMESNCKFLHPEHKCGVGFGTASKAGGTGTVLGSTTGTNSSLVSGGNSCEQLPLITADGKKKSNKKRKSKGKPAAMGVDDPSRAGCRNLTGYADNGSIVQFVGMPMA